MVPKLYIRVVFFSCFVIFLANKFVFRPFVLENSSVSFLNIVVGSLPNFLEAVMGTILISAMAIWARSRFGGRFENTSDAWVFMFATLLAAAYVIAQELKLHNLGGNNVYDGYDIIASILGLLVINRVLNRFGLSS